jgi:hypothetical protein
MLALPGRRRSRRQWSALSAFALGAVAGGVITATLAWSLSGLPRALPQSVRWAVLTLVVLVALSRDLRLLRIPLPQRSRQVPRDAFDRSFLRGAMRFGFELGLGFRTYLPSALPYVLLASILLVVPDYRTALLGGIGFGLARGLVPVFRVSTGDPAWGELSGARGRLFNAIAWGSFVTVGTAAALSAAA